jgi:hypothetical protein
MMMGEVTPGGTGTGLYTLLIYAIIAVFIGGLMIGRTPEYLGKKIQAREVKLAGLGSLVMPMIVLILTAIAVSLVVGRAGPENAGPVLSSSKGLLVVGLMVTELAAHSRHHSRLSSEELRYVAMVRELTDVAQVATRDLLVERAEPMLIDLLNLRECRFDSRPSDPPMARILVNGEVLHVGMQWRVDELGIPGPEAEIVTQWRGRQLGRFVITPTPGEPISQERRAVAVLLATVVAAGLANEKPSI